MDYDQKREYLDSRGSRCPFCKSEEIEGREINIDCDYTTQEVVCNNCGKSWRDIYQLTDVGEV